MGWNKSDYVCNVHAYTSPHLSEGMFVDSQDLYSMGLRQSKQAHTSILETLTPGIAWVSNFHQDKTLDLVRIKVVFKISIMTVFYR